MAARMEYEMKSEKGTSKESSANFIHQHLAEADRYHWLA